MFEYLMTWMRAKSEKGQDLAEYALLIGLIALMVVAAVTFFGGQIEAVFSRLGTDISTWPFPWN